MITDKWNNREAEMNPDDILTPEQVAEYTGYSIRSLARWRALGLVQPVGLVHRPRYRRRDLDELLLDLTVLPVQPRGHQEARPAPNTPLPSAPR